LACRRLRYASHWGNHEDFLLPLIPCVQIGIELAVDGPQYDVLHFLKAEERYRVSTVDEMKRVFDAGSQFRRIQIAHMDSMRHKGRIARVVILLFTAVIGYATPTPPDATRFGAFAQAWNTYIKAWDAGINDLKQWERVQRAWERLTGGRCRE
jgi:hypothetical protein